jgi:hypothetical protein
MGWTKKLKKNLKKLGKNIGKAYAAPTKLASKLAGKAGLKGISKGLEGQSDLIQGKSFKKSVKKIGEGAKAVAPTLLGLVGGSAALGSLGSKLTSALPEGLQNAVGGASDFLGKAGKFADGLRDQLNSVSQQLGGGSVGEDVQMDTPNLPDSSVSQGPPSFEDAEPSATRGGMDGKTVALIAAAGVAVLFLMRKR